MEEAKKAIAAGIDAIIVQGREAGGHVISQVRVLAIPYSYKSIIKFYDAIDDGLMILYFLSLNTRKKKKVICSFCIMSHI